MHKEFHGRDFARHGGILEMVQLWVNLPAKYKMSAPHYQSIPSTAIPVITLSDNRGSVRVIGGKFEHTVGPAHTFTSLNVWDLRLASSDCFKVEVPDGHNTLLAMLRGTVNIAGSETLAAAEVALFDRTGSHILIDHASDAVALLLSGEPIDEPISGSGPFVMNTADEIHQAMEDFQNGKMGVMT